MKRMLIWTLTLALVALSGCFWSGTQPTPSAAPSATSDAATTDAPNAQANNGTYADGHYFAAEEGFTDGWKNFMAFTVQDGRITEATWDCLPEDGSKLKSTLAAEGTYSMKAGGAQLEWDAQSKLFTDAIIQNQGLPTTEFDANGKTDAVSGVTIRVDEASSLFEAALAQGPLPQGELQDGFYYAEAQQYDNDGYREFVSMYISGGRIVEVNWNSARQDSNATKKSLGDSYGMKSASGIGAEWYQQAEAFEQYVIDNQGVGNLTTEESGKTDAISGCTISVSGAQTLTEQILTQARAAN